MTKSEEVQEQYNQLRKDPYIKKKYGGQGIYSISIEGKLVYIGKSTNMILRLSAHMIETKYSNSNKYKVLREAGQRGLNIQFGCVCHCQEAQLSYLEAYYINKYLPPLNYQIPDIQTPSHYRVNRTAKTITLKQILEDL